jgi:hypothetical protein
VKKLFGCIFGRPGKFFQKFKHACPHTTKKNKELQEIKKIESNDSRTNEEID